MQYALLALAGLAIGTVSSLTGVGGGIFNVPLLLLGGFVATTQEAVGTSAAAVLATGISGSIGYILRKKTPWKLGLVLVPGALVGTLLGAFLAGRIASGALALAFGVFLLYPAVVLGLGRSPKQLVTQGRQNFSPILAGVTGLIAGTASALFGIGGGVIMVPALTFIGLPMVEAVAGSLFAMVPTSALSTALHAIAGRTHWDLALALIAGILVGGQLGPALAVRLPQKWLRRLFALVLAYSAINMIRSGLS